MKVLGGGRRYIVLEVSEGKQDAAHLKALEGVRDDRGRLGRLLLVGGSELLGGFFVSRMLSVVAGHNRLEQ